MIQNAIYNLDFDIEEILPCPIKFSNNDPRSEAIKDFPTDIHANDNRDVNNFNISSDNDKIDSLISDLLDHEDKTKDILSDQLADPSVGDWVEVFWPIDNTFYKYLVSEITSGGRHIIL